LTVDPVNDEVKYGEDREGVNIQQDALNELDDPNK
jgi:hypothetical protein